VWPLVGREDELQFLRRARAAPAPGGVLLSGAPGVGKSRLVTESATEAREEGSWATVVLPVAPGTASFPFAALRGALDVADAPADAAGLSAAISGALRAARGSKHLLVVVDDAHLLDEESAGLLYGMVAGGETTLLATARSGATAPSAITALWKDDHVARLEVQDLSRDESRRLIAAALGGAVAESTFERLWRTTEGNPLYLREVILASLETGALRLVDEEWRWRGSWAQTTRLQEIVGERLGRLEPDELGAIEALAVGGTLPLDLLIDLSSVHAVHSLEERGLVTVTVKQDRLEVAISHPVHAEVVRSRMPLLQTRAISRRLVDAAGPLGPERSDDRLRLARWSLEAGDQVDPVTLRRAADATLWHIGETIAQRLDEILPGVAGREEPDQSGGTDPTAAIRLATKAWESSGGIDAGAHLAVVLARFGEVTQAEAVLEQLGGHSGDADDELRTALALAQVRFWGQHRADDAVDTLARAERDASEGASPLLRAQVLEDRAFIELNVGRAAAALAHARAAADRLGHELSASPSAAAAAAALALLGRSADALDLTERSMPHAVANGSRPLAVTQLLFARAGALTRAGRLEEGYELAESCRQVALDADSIDGTALFGVLCAEALLLQGRPDSAMRRLRDAAGLMAERDVLGYRPWALSSLARARAMLGDEKGAAANLAEAQDASDGPRYFDSRLYLAQSAVLGRSGRVEEAVAAARRGADRCATVGLVIDEAMLVDTWLRIDPADEVVDRLSGLTARTDSPLVRALAEHGVALQQRDAQGLLSVARSLAAMTAWLYAAEAAAAASAILTSRHHDRAARTAMRDALAWYSQCEGTRTPRRERLVAPETLTGREIEVAQLAALGLSSKAIAERLSVSIRTVDTHLYRTYAKLGVQGRSELAAALEERTGPGREDR
jgi:DNA-binding CsgD family transcriptional regulator